MSGASWDSKNVPIESVSAFWDVSIGEKLGIVDDLKKCFPDTYQQVLSIAYYLIMEDRNPMSRFPKWVSTHVHPFGNNKDHDPLPQLNLALLFGDNSRLPVYYRKLLGNISDVKTIQNLLADDWGQG